MLADVPRMTWFADIKLLLWRFADKIDDEGCALIPSSRFGFERSCPVLLFGRLGGAHSALVGSPGNLEIGLDLAVAAFRAPGPFVRSNYARPKMSPNHAPRFCVKSIIRKRMN